VCLAWGLEAYHDVHFDEENWDLECLLPHDESDILFSQLEM